MEPERIKALIEQRNRIDAELARHGIKVVNGQAVQELAPMEQSTGERMHDDTDYLLNAFNLSSRLPGWRDRI